MLHYAQDAIRANHPSPRPIRPHTKELFLPRTQVLDFTTFSTVTNVLFSLPMCSVVVRGGEGGRRQPLAVLWGNAGGRLVFPPHPYRGRYCCTGSTGRGGGLTTDTNRALTAMVSAGRGMLVAVLVFDGR
jgi:hypothetical protein